MKWLSVDWIVLGCITILCLMSILTLMSFQEAGLASVTSASILRQALAMSIGLIVALIITQIDYRILQNFTQTLFVISVISLIFVLLVGDTSGGSTRWLDLGIIRFQPTELIKIVTVILVAKYVATYYRFLTSFWFIIFSSIPIIIFVGLILLQPDLGSSIILIVVWLGMIILGGIKIEHFIWLTSMGLVVSFVLWHLALQQYQQQRIFSFLNPLSDPQGDGYNVLQSLQSISSGGMFGQGVGTGVQSTIVPEMHTDFIFSGFAQEWGFVGVTVYFVVMGIFLARLGYIAFQTQDLFSHMLVMGIILLISIQTIINIGMNMALLPITGITLPFVSFGGTSIVINFIMIGMIFSIEKHHQSPGTIYMQDRYELLD